MQQAGPSGRHPRRWTRWLVVLAALGVATVAGAELYFRTAHYEVLKNMSYPLVYEPDPVIGYRYTPGAEGRLCLPSICKHVKINEEGYLGPNFTRIPKPGVFRIAIVGSSQATGLWMDGTRSFSDGFQQRLDAAGYPVEVVNLSIDGRSRDRSMAKQIRHEVMDYQPKLVLFFVNLPMATADVERQNYRGFVISYHTPVGEAAAKRDVDEILAARWPIAVYETSYIARAAARYYFARHAQRRASLMRSYVMKRVHIPVGGEVGLYYLGVSIKALQGLQEFVAEKGGRLVLMSYTGFGGLKPMTDKAGLTRVALHMQAGPEFRHEHDGHFNQAGHDQIAELLFDYLVESGQLPRPRGRRAATGG